MRRYFVEKKLSVGEEFLLSGDLFHHIFEVCRQQLGNHFELMTNEGKAYLVEVILLQKKTASVKICEERQLPLLRKPYIHLILSVPKISTFETILEKAVELGVTSIQPVVSDFSFVKTLKSFPIEKLPRWQKIILQATQQSARGNILVLKEPKDLKQIMKAPPWRERQALGVFAYEGVCEVSFKTYLQKRKSETPDGIENLWAVIGSEGGFSGEEVRELRDLDLQPVTLGDQVLRVETACLTIVSSLKYEFDSFTKEL
jgi:16S rRNA (uracil1498-N3)-methyltransferase